MNRRTILKGGASLIAAGGLPAIARAQAPKSIRIGYAMALSGPEAQGARSTIRSQYKLWAKDVNEAGGIMLKKYGAKVPVELIEYDDRSQIEEAIRLSERLILNDKVDLTLAPWGTAARNERGSPAPGRRQSALMPAALMSCAFSVSSRLIMASNSAIESTSGSAPSLRMRSLISADCTSVLISLCRRSTISRGVFAATMAPTQKL